MMSRLCATLDLKTWWMNLPQNVDIVFIGAFSEAGQTAYALSNLFRSRGAITVLGGPHARCYPQDAQKYFDYVVGLTDKRVIHEVLEDCSQHRPIGLHITAKQQPASIPGVRERWKFIEATLKKAPFIKLVPMIGSLGCPYTCSFCIDSVIPYQPLDFDVLKEDLSFLLEEVQTPARRLARSEFRNKVRRLYECDRSSRTAKQHRLHRRKQPVAVIRGTCEAAEAQRLQSNSARN